MSKVNPERAIYLKRLEEMQIKPGQARGKIARVFFDVYMNKAHRGLSALAAEHKCDVTKLEQGEYVMFINSKNTALKMYAPGNVVAHLKLPSGMTLDREVIAMIPNFFNGGKINYDAALKATLERRLAK